MLVREYTDRDVDSLRAIHAAQGFHYAFPDLRNPLFVTKLVLSEGDAATVAQGESASPAAFSSVGAQNAAPLHRERNSSGVPAEREALRTGVSEGTSGRVVGAALLRLTAEAYLLLDPRAGTPRQRWQWLLALHEATRRDAWQRGLEDVHAWLPPRVAESFGRRLARLGWRRDDSWTPFSTRL